MTFHTNDLAVLWGMSNKNTLYTTIKRYVQKGILIPIYKGLYSTRPVHQLDPLELGRAIIHCYAYVSTETVLAQAGVISQVVMAHTLVCDRSKWVTVGKETFLFRQLRDEFLYNPIGIVQRDGIQQATPERAAADLLYFNPRTYFDVPDTLDWDRVRAIQKEIGYR